jgi:hypothetical protein
MSILAEMSGKDLWPVVLIVSGASITGTGGLAWLMFTRARQLKQHKANMAGIVVLSVFAWLFVVAALLCAGCGVATVFG